jgi:hypothetical protein
MAPDTQLVSPLYPVPPHCPHVATSALASDAIAILISLEAIFEGQIKGSNPWQPQIFVTRGSHELLTLHFEAHFYFLFTKPADLTYPHSNIAKIMARCRLAEKTNVRHIIWM